MYSNKLYRNHITWQTDLCNIFIKFHKIFSFDTKMIVKIKEIKLPIKITSFVKYFV